jgi:hypothetical protein
MVAAPLVIAPNGATFWTPGSGSTGVRQICAPVATSIANVHLPLMTYITPS